MRSLAAAIVRCYRYDRDRMLLLLYRELVLKKSTVVNFCVYRVSLTKKRGAKFLFHRFSYRIFAFFSLSVSRLSTVVAYLCSYSTAVRLYIFFCDLTITKFVFAFRIGWAVKTHPAQRKWNVGQISAPEGSKQSTGTGTGEILTKKWNCLLDLRYI
jgi:hypothetical protein